jgi:hypothetical protein
MKFAYINTDLHSAAIDKTNSGFAARSKTGLVLNFPAPPDPQSFAYDLSDHLKIPTPGRVAQHALNGWFKLDATTHRITNDSRYSPGGKKDILREHRQDAAKLHGTLDLELKTAAKHLAGAREQYYAVPTPAQNDLVTYFRELEMRNHLRSFGLDSNDGMAKATKWMQDSPSALLSVLRSPVPNAALEDYATKFWRQQRDLDDPAYVEGLLIADRSIEWSRAILQTTVNVTKRLMEDLSPAELSEMAKAGGASELYGFSAGETAAHGRSRAA